MTRLLAAAEKKVDAVVACSALPQEARWIFPSEEEKTHFPHSNLLYERRHNLNPTQNPPKIVVDFWSRSGFVALFLKAFLLSYFTQHLVSSFPCFLDIIKSMLSTFLFMSKCQGCIRTQTIGWHFVLIPPFHVHALFPPCLLNIQCNQNIPGKILGKLSNKNLYPTAILTVRVGQ